MKKQEHIGQTLKYLLQKIQANILFVQRLRQIWSKSDQILRKKAIQAKLKMIQRSAKNNSPSGRSELKAKMSLTRNAQKTFQNLIQRLKKTLEGYKIHIQNQKNIQSEEERVESSLLSMLDPLDFSSGKEQNIGKQSNLACWEEAVNIQQKEQSLMEFEASKEQILQSDFTENLFEIYRLKI